MNRQLIIGSLIGIALGGVLTSSIANGTFAGPKAAQATLPSTDGALVEPTADGDALTSFDGAPPLRPGSARVGRPEAPTPTAEIPVALDAHAAPDSPTV